MRRIIMEAFWMFITSAPSLVIRLGVEKRSILEKEKVWMASYWSCLRFRAKPAAALEPNTDPRQPTVRPHSISTLTTLTLGPSRSCRCH